MNKLISKIEISRESVTFSELDKIGEGAFGRVYKGKSTFLYLLTLADENSYPFQPAVGFVFALFSPHYELCARLTHTK